MPHEIHRSHDFSPRMLATKLEGCIIRNALDEEQRAQKALYLLKARDRRIALLEKRVVELEDAAASLHAISLRGSSTISTVDLEDEGQATLDRVQSEEKTERERHDENRDTVDENFVDFDTTVDSLIEDRSSVSVLRLSKSSNSYSDNEIFSNPVVDFAMRDSLEEPKGGVKNEVVSKTKIVSCRDQSSTDTNDYKRTPENRNNSKNDFYIDLKKEDTGICDINDIQENFEKQVRVILCAKQQGPNLPARTSRSAPWIRRKRNCRRRLRGFETKSRRCSSVTATIGRRTGTRGDKEIDCGTKKVESTVARPEDVGAFVDAQEARVIAGQKIEAETKSTQTSATALHSEESSQRIVESKNVCIATSCICLGQRKSSSFWSAEEDPAPQWLIEEALNRGAEVCEDERWTKNEETSSKEIEYENVIAELEEKLSIARADLQEALRAKVNVKDKYKRILENTKAEAHRENEMLQEKIVRICTSVLEKFGPYALSDKSKNQCPSKSRRRLKSYEKISNKLHKKLRMAVTKSKRLKHELEATKRALEDKSEKYDSMNKCFARLKQEMGTTEINLNNLIAENVSLRKKIEDTREWMEFKMGKEQYEKPNALQFRDIQRSRELTNLKKKAEEDFATITQLRSKLLRSESANANKGFLLNSYKSQLADLNKEKEQIVTKTNELENEVSLMRNSNAQLKAKISFLNIEKEKLISDSKTDVTQKSEIQSNEHREKLMQEEIAAIRTKYEETITILKSQMKNFEMQNVEYSKAIKEFLKKIHQYFGDNKVEKNSSESEASEKAAEETACNILNMTPDELSGLIKGKPSNSINSWLNELSRIISRKCFSDSLSKFLFKKTVKKIGT